jgi:chorismate synthase
MVPAAGVVGEAMTALTLAAALLEKFGGDNLTETLDNHHRFIDRITCWKE